MSADAEMSAAIAAAAALEPTESEDATKNEPDAGDVADASEGAASGKTDAAGEDADAVDGPADADESEAAADDAVGVESLQSVGALFTDGDVAGACKLLGIDPKILAFNVPKFEAMRRGLKETKRLEASALAAKTEADGKLANANAIIADGKKQYGALVDLKLSLKKGDFYAAKEILEALAPDGTTYQQIAEGLAAAHKGTSPSEVAYRRKLREIAENERKAEEAKAAETIKATEAAEETARAARNRAGASKLLKGSAFEGLPGAEDALIKLAADHWDPVKKGLRVAPAALVKLLAKDPLLGAAAELRRLKAKAPAAPVAKPAVVRDDNGKFRNPRSGQKVDKVTAAENERKAAIAEAARMEQQAARAGRRGAR